MGIRVKVEVNGQRDGSVVINARKLLELIKSLVDPNIATVSVEVENFLAKIRWSERGQASITGFDASDFPPFPEVSEGDTLNFAKSELEFLVEKTKFAPSARIAIHTVGRTVTVGGYRLGQSVHHLA